MKERKIRAKRVRREAAQKAQKAKASPRRLVVEPDQVDEYDEKAVKAMAANTPEVRFRHASYFTNDEDKIIAASLKSRIQLYKVAASLKCAYNTLKKHIDNTPVLAEIAREAREIECGELREAVDDLVKMRHPQVVMWRARQLMPQEYGEAVEAEEDDTRIVIGAIPDELLAEADRALERAAENVPDVGLAALMDPRVEKGSEAKAAKVAQPKASVAKGGNREPETANAPEIQEEDENAVQYDGDETDEDGMFGDDQFDAFEGSDIGF